MVTGEKADPYGVACPPIHYASPGDRQKFDIVQSIRTLTLLRHARTSRSPRVPPPHPGAGRATSLARHHPSSDSSPSKPGTVGTPAFFMAIFDSVETAGEAVSAVISGGLVPATLEMMDHGKT